MPSANIILGIGGTGIAIVYNIYKKLNRRLPENLRLLMYDSDINSKPKDFPAQYFYSTVERVENAEEFCKRCYSPNSRISPEFTSYWPGVRLGLENKCAELGQFSGTGLGQSRPKGFLGLLKHLEGSRRITDGILSVYNEIIHPGSDVIAGAKIYIVGSFAGGTGSGSFIDIAFLLRKTFMDSNLNLNIYGYFILGDAAMRNRATPGHISYDWACANTYAAFWELRYWQNPGRSFQKRYGANLEVSISNRTPYDAVHLIDAENIKGVQLNGYEEYEKLVSDICYDLLVRPSTQRHMATVFDNIYGHGLTFGSAARGIILYPKKDILRLMGLWFLSDYVEKVVIPEQIDKIREKLNADLKTKLSLFSGFTTDIKNIEIPGIGGNTRFPNVPPFGTGLRGIDDRNYERELNDIFSICKDTHPAKIQNFLEQAFMIYLEQKKQNFLEHLRQEIAVKNISFLHGYLTNLLQSYLAPEIENKNKENREKNMNKENILGEIEAEINYIKNRRGGNRRERDSLNDRLQKYCKALEDSLLTNWKLKFLEQFFNYVQKIKNSVNVIHDYIKKAEDGLLPWIRSKCHNYEQEYETTYEGTPFRITILPINENLDFYKELYNEKAYSEGNIIINELTEDFERKIAEKVFNRILPVYLDNRTLDFQERQRMFSEIRENAIKSFEQLFTNIPQDIFDALYIECVRKNEMDYSSYLRGVLTRMQREAQPFLKLESGINYNPAQCILANLRKLSETITNRKIGGMEVTIEEETGRITYTAIPNVLHTDEFDDQIVFVNIATGYDYNNLPAFKESGPPGLYFIRYKSVIENPDINLRYEVFTDLRYNPRGLPAKLLFLLCEYAGVIVKVMDKKGNETGVYKFGKDTLETDLKGRANNINWFVEDRNPAKRKEIIEEFQKNHWGNLSPNDRKGYFDKVLNSLIETKRRETLSRELTEIYEENVKTMKDAINAGYYNTNDFTGLI